MNSKPLHIDSGFNHKPPMDVIYIENQYNVEVNNFIQSNIQLITDIYLSQDINFIYLPTLLKSEEYKNIFNYNHPYLNVDFQDSNLDDVYKTIINEYNLSINKCALISYKYFRLNDIILQHEIDESSGLRAQFLDFPIETQKRLSIIKQRENEQRGVLDSPMFNIVSSNKIKEEEVLDTFSLKYNETEFEKELNKHLQILIERGSLQLIGSIIDKLKNATQELSMLIITSDYRLFLKDYGMKEVEMSPLPKSLFILFLRHPEGIPFKSISDYEDELFSIYKDITRTENMEQVRERINALINPLDNSINEKCSRIRASFIKVIPDFLAKNYYITGYKSEPKRILLDSSLVEFKQ